MSLLTNVMDHSLDEGYAEASARRIATGTAGLPRTLKAKLGLAAGLVLAGGALRAPTLNEFMALGWPRWSSPSVPPRRSSPLRSSPRNVPSSSTASMPKPLRPTRLRRMSTRCAGM